MEKSSAILLCTEHSGGLPIFYDVAQTLRSSLDSYGFESQKSLDTFLRNSWKKYKRIIILAWSNLHPFPQISFGFDNLYIYGAQTICKSQQLKVLSDAGLPTVQFLKIPKTYDEIFDILGEKVVIKPDEYCTLRCQGVQIKQRGESINNPSRWLYTQYIGNPNPPYFKYRITCAFGDVVYAYGLMSQISPIIRLSPKSEIIPGNIPEILEISKKASRILTDIYGCGLVGIDIIKGPRGFTIIEANPGDVGLRASDANLHDKFNKVQNLAEALLKQLAHIGENEW